MASGFLIDTNVLSELMRGTPAPQVLDWFATQTPTQLYTSVITYAEMLAGVALLPAGKRREGLAQATRQMFEEDFAGRCLDFSGLAVSHYAMVRAQRQQAGRPIDTADAQIAAIALSGNLTLVTRNTKDFAGIDALNIINPWQAH
ncbi:MAG: type II toxin-antitoxin system VapC family toxin [Limnohabitans sp.]|nr:MAG: type II toxin-antitoxin system VapC family toxin [Limnohabitans sp.]